MKEELIARSFDMLNKNPEAQHNKVWIEVDGKIEGYVITGNKIWSDKEKRFIN